MTGLVSIRAAASCEFTDKSPLLIRDLSLFISAASIPSDAAATAYRPRLKVAWCPQSVDELPAGFAIERCFYIKRSDEFPQLRVRIVFGHFLP